MSESISIIRSYQDGVCPDCGLEIPLEVVAGQACQNCGHVFVPPHPSDDEETSMLDEAKCLIKAIKEFDVVKEGDSGDAEYDAALEMEEASKAFLRAASARNIELAELIDQELPE